MIRPVNESQTSPAGCLYAFFFAAVWCVVVWAVRVRAVRG